MFSEEQRPTLQSDPSAPSEAGADPGSAPLAEPEPAVEASSVSRRNFLRGAAVAGGGPVVATRAHAAPGLDVRPDFDSERRGSARRAARLPRLGFGGVGGPSAPACGVPPSPSPVRSPRGWSDSRPRRPGSSRRSSAISGHWALRLDEPRLPTDEPEYTKVPQGNQPLEPTLDGDVKVFDMTVDEIDWPIDALSPPLKALGYNKMWPGPILRVVEGDKVRVKFTNNLPESTGVHFHGIEFTDFKQDGIPFVTQLPIVPGGTFTYEFVARGPAARTCTTRTTTRPTRSAAACWVPSSSIRRTPPSDTTRSSA
jgi:FtsP/CotA-like multicopper oxidase with cupredoxin domain